MRPTRIQARILIELNRGNLIISTKDQMGRRYARWKNPRGKKRAGKPGVGTFRAFRKRGWIETEDVGVGTWRISEAGTEVVLGLDLEWYDKPRKVKVTANDVLTGLEAYYSQTGLVMVPEVSVEYGGERRVDALIVGRGNETAIIAEVKVSRGDFRHELDQPDKRARAIGLSSQYFFAAPQGMIKPKEIPPECGLLELGKDGKIYVTLEAPHRRPGMPDWRLCGAIARALKR